jgi:hypothetical protein
VVIFSANLKRYDERTGGIVMKKVIRNKVYDTDTAQLLGDWDNGYYTSDFQYCAEALYRKRTGEYFLHGAGHAMSKYAGHSGNSSGWGEKITPLTYEEAREWAEAHLDADDYISIFGEPAEDDSVTALNLTLSSASVAKFKAAAQQQQISQRELMERLIDAL